jgi:ATP-dependent RNA helicase DDX23/PRP28
MPETIEQYTHRIGRTGRAGRKGVAMALVTYKNTPLFYDLKHLLQETGNKVPKAISQHEASKQRGGKEGENAEQQPIIH